MGKKVFINYEHAPKTLKDGEAYLYIVIYNTFRKKEVSFLGSNIIHSISPQSQNSVYGFYEKRIPSMNGGRGTLSVVYLGTIQSSEFRDSSYKHISKWLGRINKYPLNVTTRLNDSSSYYYKIIERGFSTFKPFSTTDYNQKFGLYSLQSAYKDDALLYITDEEKELHTMLLNRADFKKQVSLLNIQVIYKLLKLRKDSTIIDVVDKLKMLSFWDVSHYTNSYIYFKWNSEKQLNIIMK